MLAGLQIHFGRQKSRPDTVLAKIIAETKKEDTPFLCMALK